MQAELDRDHVSHRDAAARLRYLADVQQRARRAALTPSFALVALGAIAVCHGVGDVMIGRGLAPATGQIIVGVGLLAAGLMSLARERERA